MNQNDLDDNKRNSLDKIFDFIQSLLNENMNRENRRQMHKDFETLKKNNYSDDAIKKFSKILKSSDAVNFFKNELELLLGRNNKTNKIKNIDNIWGKVLSQTGKDIYFINSDDIMEGKVYIENSKVILTKSKNKIVVSIKYYAFLRQTINKLYKVIEHLNYYFKILDSIYVDSLEDKLVEYIYSNLDFDTFFTKRDEILKTSFIFRKNSDLHKSLFVNEKCEELRSEFNALKNSIIGSEFKDKMEIFGILIDQNWDYINIEWLYNIRNFSNHSGLFLSNIKKDIDLINFNAFSTTLVNSFNYGIDETKYLKKQSLDELENYLLSFLNYFISIFNISNDENVPFSHKKDIIAIKYRYDGGEYKIDHPGFKKVEKFSSKEDWFQYLWKSEKLPHIKDINLNKFDITKYNRFEKINIFTNIKGNKNLTILSIINTSISKYKNLCTFYNKELNGEIIELHEKITKEIPKFEEYIMSPLYIDNGEKIK